MRLTFTNLLLVFLAFTATFSQCEATPGCGTYPGGPRYVEKPCDDNVTSSPTDSRTPTESPTVSPTTSHMPSVSPSPTLTPSPTRTPSPTATAMPTRTRSPSLSPAPTVTATPTTTPAPTLSPAPTASAAPTEACVTDNEGSFGTTTGGDPLDNVIEVPVEFAYELETTGFRDATTDVIPDLERSFNDAILPILFAGSCGDTMDKSNANVVGVSTKLPDTIFSGIVCDETSMTDAINDCHVVKGSLTIFVRDESLRSDSEPGDVSDDVLGRLETAMTNGDFESSERDVVRVSFVEIDSVGGSENPGGSVNTPGTGDDNSDQRVLYGVIAGVATLLIVAVALAWRKRQQASKDAADASTLETPTTEPATGV